jgi:hypothetical protein
MPVPQVPHVSPALARSARDHFQHLYAQPQSEEDGREMATNVLGAFAVLAGWREKKRAQAAEAANSGTPPASRSKKKREASTANQE